MGNNDFKMNKNIKKSIKIYEKIKKKVTKLYPKASDYEIDRAISKASEYNLKDEKDAIKTTIRILKKGDF